MFTYFKMKKAEWKVKAMFYGTIANIIDNKKDIIDTLQKIFAEFKDVPADEIKSELISKAAELSYAEATK